MNLHPQDILFLQNRVAYTRDEQAYKKVFFHFHPSLYRFAFHMLNDAGVAEEIVSDVMMRIWDLGSKLAQVDNLNVYLFTAIKNACINQLSKTKWKKVTWDEDVENARVDMGNDPEHLLLYTEIERKVASAIASLPPQCQLIFRLIREEGLSYKEVSAIAEISQNTIETQMRIALRKIRLALDNYLQGKI